MMMLLPETHTPRLVRVQPSRNLPEPLEELQTCLRGEPRSIPPKYFYDARGAELFDRICATPEYYPTRTEDKLLRRHAGAIIDTCRPAEILELGPGNARKTRHLFNACRARGHPCRYVPLDVCEAYLAQVCAELQAAYPWLNVSPLAGDYNAGLANLPRETEPPAEQGSPPVRLLLFLGSTIGNLAEQPCRLLLNDLRALMRPQDRLLLGADRHKAPAILDAAYNDSQGLTAEFNRNVLRVLNRLLQADFRPERFAHRAAYLPEAGQVEMHLVSEQAQQVRADHLEDSLELRAGEPILTEISRKFSYPELEATLAESGLRVTAHYESENAHYSLLLAAPREHDS